MGGTEPAGDESARAGDCGRWPMAWEGDLGREGWHLPGSGQSPGLRASVAPDSMACSRTVGSRVASASGAARGDQVGLVGGLVLWLSKGRAVSEPRWHGRLGSGLCGASEVVRGGHVHCSWCPRRSAVGGGGEYMKGEEEQWRESGDAGKMQDLSALQSLVKCSVLTR